MRPLTRVAPVLPAAAMVTYALSAPPDRTIKTACERAGCEQWRHGWETHLDEATPDGRRLAAYIRQVAGRTFAEKRTAVGITVFRFPSGQRCFREHFTRPEVYLVHGGDWREHRGLIRRHLRPIDWVEDMGENLQAVTEQIEKG